MHSRLISSYGGVVNFLPKYSFLFLIFVMGGLGLPGTSGFLGEFLVLAGTFQKSFLAAILASLGVILGAAYMLWLAKRVIFGEVKNPNIKKMKDINFSEGSILILLGLTTIFFGFYPQPLIETMNVSVNNLISNYELDINNHLINFNDK